MVQRTVVTLCPAAIAAVITRSPGSEIAGVPASLTSRPARATFEQLEDLANPLPLVVSVQRKQAGSPQSEPGEQLAGVARVLAAHDVRILQRRGSPWGEVTDVAYRGGDDHEFTRARPAAAHPLISRPSPGTSFHRAKAPACASSTARPPRRGSATR